ncbi:hypothetical protein SY83_20300 [Paenibacillus swuensis]|uniref:BD-FAE-like domain-containing protein n=1 Tax=Paenibacillus swuensis TaxID=1178515 RepID=A0A172TMX6_9BACL|nr:alpha/beta hydrolase [Paenibacillus swuensis]ANE48244.1 hypothetical protein SY83_20300 [Paenibacillus swuensis]
MSDSTSEILLWPEGAPLAKGAERDDCPSITPYLVQANKPVAAVVICPGGGYWLKAPHEGEPIARWLNSIGISAFVLHYRTADADYHYPCPLLDAQRAIRTVRCRAEEWNVDPDRIGILGFSAGGHLAGSIATLANVSFAEGHPLDAIDSLDAKPNALVLGYPVITMGDGSHSGSFDNLLKGQTDPAIRVRFSLERNVDASTPQAFLWHTADDEGVPVTNSLLFAEALTKYGVPYDLHVFRKGAHGLGLAEDDAHVGKWTVVCAQWLQAIGFASIPVTAP